MSRLSLKALSLVLASTALTACGGEFDTTRSATSVQVPQVGPLSALASQFQAQTTHVVYFGFNEDWLDIKAKRSLDTQAEWILSHPDVTFRVYGHADRVGSAEYNIDLGLRRAMNAVNYLVSKGIEEERLEALVSFGEDDPQVETENRERFNRRVVTEVFGIVRENDASSNLMFGSSSGTIAATPTPTSASPNSNTEREVTSDSSPTSEPKPSSDPSPTSEPDTTSDAGSGKNPNSGRGNGDEAGDPGKSGGKNKGGDEA